VKPYCSREIRTRSSAKATTPTKAEPIAIHNGSPLEPVNGSVPARGGVPDEIGRGGEPCERTVELVVEAVVGGIVAPLVDVVDATVVGATVVTVCTTTVVGVSVVGVTVVGVGRVVVVVVTAGRVVVVVVVTATVVVVVGGGRGVVVVVVVVVGAHTPPSATDAWRVATT